MAGVKGPARVRRPSGIDGPGSVPRPWTDPELRINLGGRKKFITRVARVKISLVFTVKQFGSAIVGISFVNSVVVPGGNFIEGWLRGK